VATEDEMRAARVEKAKRLRDFGTQPFPNDLRADDAIEAKRAELAALARDEASCPRRTP